LSPAEISPRDVTLSIDAMGADHGPLAFVRGLAIARQRGLGARAIVVGRSADIMSAYREAGTSADALDADLLEAEAVVTMEDKPSQVLRRGRDTSMWQAINAVQSGQAHGIVSGGNTGALMAVARHQLKMIASVDRPAITALWPTKAGRSVVLDVGANVDAEPEQLVHFAVMGEAFFRSLHGKARPSIGLLNVGAEELKGHGRIRDAARILRERLPDLDFRGFVEGNDISSGTVDVVVTDGFSGNIAIKSAEGAARLVGGWMGDAVRRSWLTRLGSLFMAGELKALKERMNPSSVNGGVFLGLNGLVVKSHGSADAEGVASALMIAESLARRALIADVAERMGNLACLSEEPPSQNAPDDEACKRKAIA